MMQIPIVPSRIQRRSPFLHGDWQSGNDDEMDRSGYCFKENGFRQNFLGKYCSKGYGL